MSWARWADSEPKIILSLYSREQYKQICPFLIIFQFSIDFFHHVTLVYKIND